MTYLEVRRNPESFANTATLNFRHDCELNQLVHPTFAKFAGNITLGFLSVNLSTTYIGIRMPLKSQDLENVLAIE